MRLSQEALNIWLWLAKWLTRLLGATSICAGALIKAAPSSFGLTADPATDLVVQKVAMVAFPLLLIATPISDSFRRWLERKTLWPLVKEILEEFRKQIYPASKDPVHLHRVTLFRHCPWVMRRRLFKGPYGFGWLKIIERSGHTSRNSRTVFFAPNDPDKAEGVAGVAWAWNTVVFREDLPDVRSNGATDVTLEEYAKGSNTPLPLVRQLKPVSRSLCGIPIEVRGRVWGVLVVDSRHPKLPKKLIEQHWVLAAKFLSRVLERV